jgi:transglutaminase-like putative cysteine protease
MNEHPVRATVLACLAVALSGLALLGVMLPGRWLAQTAGLVLAIGLAMGVARWWRLWLPGPAGLIALAGYVTAACTPFDAILWVIPTPESVRDLGDQILAAADAIQANVPLTGDPAVYTPVVLLGLGLATLVAVAFAADLNWPALAGLPVVAPWIAVGFIQFEDASRWVLAAAAVYLALLAYTGRRTRPLWKSRWILPGIAVAVAAPLAVLPLARELPFWGSQRDAWTGFVDDLVGGTGPATHPSLELGLDLGSDLRDRSSTVLVRTQLQPGADGTIPAAGQRLRVTTLYDFDGVEWNPSDHAFWDWLAQDSFVWPEMPGSGIWEMGVTLDIEIVSLDQDLVPITLGPRWINGLTRAEYDWYSDSVRADPRLASGAAYRIVTGVMVPGVLATLTAPQLGMSEATRLPDTPSVATLTELAHALTDGIDGDYAKLDALEDYFHGPEFEYSLTVPDRGTGDPMGEFLEAKSGFCSQYASAFTLMARSLGYQARIALGFTEGSPTGTAGQRAIRGTNSHAWPEVYFEGAGWVAFEPTPGIGGVRPDEPAAAATATPTPKPVPTPGASASAAPEPSATGGPGGSGTGAAALWLRANAVWLGAVLVGLAALAGAQLARRYRRAHATAEEVWRTLAGQAQLTGLVPAGASVRVTADTLAGRLEEPAATAARDLGDLIEARRYAPPGPADAAADDRAARAWRDLIERGQPFARGEENAPSPRHEK